MKKKSFWYWFLLVVNLLCGCFVPFITTNPLAIGMGIVNIMLGASYLSLYKTTFGDEC